MPVIGLYDNYVGPPGAIALSTSSFELATRFYVDEDCYVRRISWYRFGTGSPAPTALRCWDSTTSSVVFTAPTIPDNGAVGWQRYTFPVSPFTLLAGRVYVASISCPINTVHSNQATTTPITPPAGIHFDSNARGYRTGSFGYPTNFDNAIYEFVQVEVETAPVTVVPTEPVTNSTLDQRLQAWLDKDSTDYPDSAPIRTDTLLHDGTNGLAAIKTAVNGVATDMLRADSAVISGINSKIDGVDAILQGILGPSGSVFTGLLRTYLDGLQEDIDNTLALAGTIRGAATVQAGPSVTGWTLVSSDAFAGTFVVDEECDRVTVIATDWGSDRRVNVFGGLEFFTEPMWWAPLRGGAIVGRYHTFRSTASDLYEPGQRMGGVIVHCAPDVSGTYEVWRFDGV